MRGRGGWLRQRARELRQQQTLQEAQLWQCLRSRHLAGCKFRRQAPVGRYIVDFLCVQARLVVELDGEHHQDEAPHAHDVARDAWLQSQGLTVIRIHNSAWMTEPEAVLAVIERALRQQLKV